MKNTRNKVMNHLTSKEEYLIKVFVVSQFNKFLSFISQWGLVWHVWLVGFIFPQKTFSWTRVIFQGNFQKIHSFTKLFCKYRYRFFVKMLGTTINTIKRVMFLFCLKNNVHTRSLKPEKLLYLCTMEMESEWCNVNLGSIFQSLLEMQWMTVWRYDPPEKPSSTWATVFRDSASVAL